MECSNEIQNVKTGEAFDEANDYFPVQPKRTSKPQNDATGPTPIRVEPATNTKARRIRFASSNIMCLPQMLQEQAKAHPNTIAVCSNNGSLSFHELVGKSTCIALYLRHLGVVADSCVGIFVEPSLDLMVGIWGTLFANGAYLPLSPEYPEERLRYMLDHARIKIVFTQESLRKKLSELAPPDMQIITLKNVMTFMKLQLTQSMTLPIITQPHDLAYVIYTSGSTGKPKGVMIEQCSIVSQMKWMQDTYGLNKTKIVLQKTPMSFDAAQWEIISPACGCTVVMGHTGIYRDVKGLIDTIREHRVTTLQCVPTLLQALLDTDKISECQSLTQIFSGGEALSTQLAQQCIKKLPSCDLINLYGPTECTINASSHLVNRNTLANGSNSIPIGMPVNNTQFYILDSNWNLVQAGEMGELYIGGIQLARGYLHQPEMSTERFVKNPFATDPSARMYKTGDLVCMNPDGSYQFVGRVDNQVKLRGFRIELDEVRLAIERHEWIKKAAVLPMQNNKSDTDHLIAYIELSAKDAALMDQGNHGTHHQSKTSRVQVRAQLSNLGCRETETMMGKPLIQLPGKADTDEQRKLVFGRKTYRFYEGREPVTKRDLERLLEPSQKDATKGRDPMTMSLNEFGEILRYFGQFLSEDRLLPKYGYASPGALYATQMYIEICGMPFLKSGYYYYHPVHHHLIQIRDKIDQESSHIKIHFIGKKRAIEPVYKTNIREVLEIETGHMLGLFDAVLPNYGLSIGEGINTPDVIDQLECYEDDYYLGTFGLASSYGQHRWDASLDLYVQTHLGKILDMQAGQYQYQNGNLVKVSNELIQKNHVIAINQQVYERSSFGITVLDKNDDWLSYITLGRKLQQLQMNDQYLGFMSSGYSSKSGNNLPAATRMYDILARCKKQAGPCYFFIGGRVSEEQWENKGMKEDTVHMKGPAEMIKEDLALMLPNYMVPKQVFVLDKMPLSANGKIDLNALKAMKQTKLEPTKQPCIPPRNQIEERIGEIWQEMMKLETISVKDDFFESGGNSLIAVSMAHQLNREFKKSLPLQTIFEAPTIEKLAILIKDKEPCSSSRLIPLHLEKSSAQRPIYCWPGLGGYPMNLRLLGRKVGLNRSFFGVQAYGINEKEVPYATIKEMAAHDIEQIRCLQPTGPYTLWGYSFGARVAFEAAYQLEQMGEKIDHLFLIAPGSPKVDGIDESICQNEATFNNRSFITILFSVFARSIKDPELDDCLACTKDEASFVSFITSKYPHLHLDIVTQVVRIVKQTFEFKYTFHELSERCLKTPITIFEAQGDDYSFIENSGEFSLLKPEVIKMEADHYSLLKNGGVDELIKLIHERINE